MWTINISGAKTRFRRCKGEPEGFVRKCRGGLETRERDSMKNNYKEARLGPRAGGKVPSRGKARLAARGE